MSLFLQFIRFSAFHSPVRNCIVYSLHFLAFSICGNVAECQSLTHLLGLKFNTDHFGVLEKTSATISYCDEFDFF